MKFLKNFLDYSHMPMFEAVKSIDSSNMGLLLHHDGSQESAQKMQRYADELMEKSSSHTQIQNVTLTFLAQTWELLLPVSFFSTWGLYLTSRT